MKLAIAKYNGDPITMQLYDRHYIDLVIGRFGTNQGMEKGIGDQKFRDALLMYDALQRVNEAIAEGAIGPEKACMLFTSRKGKGVWKTEPSPLAPDPGTGKFDLGDPDLEKKLGHIDIGTFRHRIESPQAVRRKFRRDRRFPPAGG
ncbi:MAG: hypothetical protein WDN72_11205 [Alphaproteobacteria bacterium]